MSTEDTKAVLDHHQEMLDAGDVDGLMSDYTEDSVFITNLGGAVKGLEGIRAVFAPPPGACPASSCWARWSRATSPTSGGASEGIPFGTDTFVVRDGKIATQTVALQLG